MGFVNRLTPPIRSHKHVAQSWPVSWAVTLSGSTCPAWPPPKSLKAALGGSHTATDGFSVPQGRVCVPCQE